MDQFYKYLAGETGQALLSGIQVLRLSTGGLNKKDGIIDKKMVMDMESYGCTFAAEFDEKDRLIDPWGNAYHYSDYGMRVYSYGSGSVETPEKWVMSER